MDLGPCKVAGLGAHMQLLTQLLYCLAHMLRQPYPCPVPLPGQALLGLASSVLQIQPAGACLLAELFDCVVQLCNTQVLHVGTRKDRNLALFPAACG